MKTATSLALAALSLLASCAGTPAPAGSDPLAPEILAADDARARVTELHPAAADDALEGRLAASYPSLPGKRVLTVTFPGEEPRRVEVQRQPRTRRHKRPQRAPFVIELP
jgi:hypothetical protein